MKTTKTTIITTLTLLVVALINPSFSYAATPTPNTTQGKPPITNNPNDPCLKALFPATTKLTNIKINDELCSKITNTLITQTKANLFNNFAGNIATNLFIIGNDKSIQKNKELQNSILSDQKLILKKILNPIDAYIVSQKNLSKETKVNYQKVISDFFNSTLKVTKADIDTMYTAVGELKLTAGAKNGNLTYISTKDKTIIYTFDKNKKIISAVLNKVTYKYNLIK
jgi:hypothetical protein